MMPSKLRYVPGAAAVIAAVALSFAAGVKSAALYTVDAVGTTHSALLADLVRTAPFDYFPSQYENQGKEIEPLPPQF